MKTKASLLLSFLAIAVTGTLHAATAYDQNIVAIFGSGNPDTGWTTSTEGNLVLGLRAKNRVTASTANVNGLYLEQVGLVPPNNNRAYWNFEFSISSGAVVLSAYDYYLEIDTDASTGTTNTVVNALTFFSDNSYGTSTTLNGQGAEGASSVYAPVSTVAQQSQNIVFYGIDATQDSTFAYSLYAVAAGAGPNGARLATTSILAVVGIGGPVLPDDDGDGVPNNIDQCPNTGPGEAVDVHGCSVQDEIDKCAVGVRNHGQYVSAVTAKLDEMFKAGRISKSERQSLHKAAAQSDIGKK